MQKPLTAMGVVRRWGLVAVLCVVVQLGAPRRADALFEWLDHLSGPGPFQGIELQYRLFCLMRQADPKTAPDTAVTRLKDVEAKGPIDFNTRLPLDRSLAASVAATIVRLRQPMGRTLTSGELLTVAAQIRGNIDAVRDYVQQNRQAVPDSARLTALVRAWEDAVRLLRESAVPRVREAPGSFLWATCYDHPNPASSEVYTVTDPASMTTETVQHRDRHPVFSLNFNYRYYTNGTFLFFGPSTNTSYAHGQSIQLQVADLQPSFPIASFLDAQVAAGVYWFTSTDFGKFAGLIVEPMRLDLHAPASWIDGRVDDYGVRRPVGPLLRFVYALSLRGGFVMFPGGFSTTAFNATGADAKEIRGSELIPSFGVVMNVGRLFGK